MPSQRRATPMMRPMRLTKRLLEAMAEALTSRLADDLDAVFTDEEDKHPEYRDYDDALSWVSDQLSKRRGDG